MGLRAASRLTLEIVIQNIQFLHICVWIFEFLEHFVSGSESSNYIAVDSGPKYENTVVLDPNPSP